MHRHSREYGFSKPSIYCNGLKAFYEKVSDYLLKGGIPESVILNSLGVTQLAKK